MPTTKLIKPKPIEPTKNTLEKPKQLKATVSSGTESEANARAVRKNRASSCSRCPQKVCSGVQRKARSTSTAPKPTERNVKTRTNQGRATSCVRQTDVQKCRNLAACAPQKEQLNPKAETKYAIQSHKAFTVIPPNPKKRRDIQRKAEAELAALEELRLSRAMAYVSIDPSSVGGCMSLEEVRLKQQQEMSLARRKQKQVKKQVIEETVLTS